MNPSDKSNWQTVPSYYDVSYGNFQIELYSEIRRETFGEDIGQNSWLTASEQDMFVGWLGLTAGKTLLDVACGAGGPALRLAALTGCTLTGVDVNEQAISTARRNATFYRQHPFKETNSPSGDGRVGEKGSKANDFEVSNPAA